MLTPLRQAVRELSDWSIVTKKDDEGSYKALVGIVVSESDSYLTRMTISSRIVKYEGRTLTTESGRIYHLIGRARYDLAETAYAKLDEETTRLIESAP